ncbi:unnamed protein product [Candidula unifasciata]|uniref:non-specific serine/threonine protein kinase n=1 Tax=Candidula unifasciata TaxID=100452 RepID=A0A8S3YJL6_9EUPU|nr:unnamed protein product [Candidula unifasciata]
MPPSRPLKDSDTKKARVLANRYEIVKKLGSGNFGTAFLCQDLKSGNQLKVLKETPVDLQPDETVDAMREARFLSKLEHPGVVKCYDNFITEDSFCIITEYCEGGDLDQKIKERKHDEEFFDEKTILDWTVQLLLAAEYMHSRRVLHRDLKTRNIFIQNNKMKLGDFGISRILMGTTDMASTFTGTPYYMSPEVLKHEGYNSKSDIWSIGCIMYELCTLEHAFSGQGLMHIMYKIVDKDPPELPSKYSNELNEIIKKILVKDPDLRPSAAEVLKFPYIARHRAKMKDTLTDEYKAKHNISPETAEREATELASLLRESSHLEDLRNTLDKSGEQSASETRGQLQTPTEKKQTPRERMRQKKMQEADKKARELKKLAKIQLVENFARKQKIKTSLEKVSVPIWKGGHGEGEVLKQALSVRNDKPLSGSGREVLLYSAVTGKNSCDHESDSSEGENTTVLQTVIRRNSERGAGERYRGAGAGRLTRSFSQGTARTDGDKPAARMVKTIGGMYPDDRQITPMRDKMIYDREHSSLDFKDGIPDTPEEANTFYEQFDDFDGDDVIDTEDTLKHAEEELIHHLEAALSKYDNEESTVFHDDVAIDTYGPLSREIKITNIRAECKKTLGQDVFDKAYSYLKEARRSEKRKDKSEKEIMDGLRQYVKNPSDCFLVDQLLFLEEQARLS